jgi:capsular polysaccharide biosynthesis protein
MELELRDYIQIIMRRIWLIISIVLVSTIATTVISFYFIQPEYAANAKIIVNKLSDTTGVQVIDSSTINASILLVNTYKEIVKSPVILEKVLSRFPNLKLTVDQLATKISVNSTNDTQVISLVVNDANFLEAVKIVNAVAEVFKQEIPTIMSVDNVNILNKALATDNPKPVKNVPQMNIAISFLVSLMIALGIVILLEYLDETIRTEKDIEMYLEVPLLAVVSTISSKDLKVNKRQKRVGEVVNVSVHQ